MPCQEKGNINLTGGEENYMGKASGMKRREEKPMKYNFDAMRERRGTDSNKWGKYGPDVLPLWVADMDFVSAAPILRALHERVEHGFFGYTRPSADLFRVIGEHLARRYDWEVLDEEIVFLPGLVSALNLAIQAFTRPGEGVLVQPPVYHHFVHDPVHRGRTLLDPPLVPRGDSYEIDFDAFAKAITPESKIFILCNPHNPVGRVFTRKELERLSEICLRHHLLICSDEIHCGLLFRGYQHIPIATLAPEVANRTITLMAPSKTYNLAGLGLGFAIIKNPSLRRQWKEASMGLIPHVNIMGHVAALAAFREGQEWLDQVLVYLEENRDLLTQFLKREMPQIRMSRIEATYLAWLDCREAGIQENPFEFFLNKAGVALNNGAEFGRGGEGFVRLNFACPRSLLRQALARMATTLKKHGSTGEG
jgi:cystathionine beta-lyase